MDIVQKNKKRMSDGLYSKRNFVKSRSNHLIYVTGKLFHDTWISIGKITELVCSVKQSVDLYILLIYSSLFSHPRVNSSLFFSFRYYFSLSATLFLFPNNKKKTLFFSFLSFFPLMSQTICYLLSLFFPKTKI